ncbi:hypothetical protein [Pararhodobacter zhoushanensis]|uniref:Secreted protein n=1 Tax=Pararhodobacter zhoushanensis TaxID=2479545 RepID=A0ABT3H3W0_9RHOB|nr:hypothetical protein [Pararhodobacter zhoushanensis]MCW1934393.1 hypothetical protein [Pararhodobacter zhoushanensis]
MTRFALTLAALSTLTLNGSMASASISLNPMPVTPVSASCTPETPCVISLRMLSAPRPAPPIWPCATHNKRPTAFPRLVAADDTCLFLPT